MVGWYNPPRLISTGVRVAISSVFGEFADRREMMAADQEIDPHAIDAVYDFSRSPAPLWLDFVADTGDGWNPTYAIARLLAEPKLHVHGCDEALPLADVVVMGGDEVYPTASRDEYRDRLFTPFETAKRFLPEDVTPRLFAVPGNHDWYDGLLAFLGLFCRRRKETDWNPGRAGRVIGGRLTQQTRSYFALKLLRDWWLWGVDVQLSGYIDQPQIDFFRHAASEWMDPGSRLILCTGTPDWSYVDQKNPEEKFRNFSYLEGVIDAADRGHKLRLILSGDSHHYARYTEGDRQYITAGGGGAFLHPTHHLTDHIFRWRYPQPGASPDSTPPYWREFRLARHPLSKEPIVFPSVNSSKRLAWRNLAFAFLNWPYTITLAVLCGIFAWTLDFNARTVGSSLAGMLRDTPSFWSAVLAYRDLLILSPWPILLLCATVAGYVYFADFGRLWRHGLAHAFCQIGIFAAMTIMLAQSVPFGDQDWFLIVCIAVLGGLVSASIMGVYLLVALNVFGVHWNEAFSALRIQDYKCFLRLRINDEGKLTVFPIGLANVPRDDQSIPPKNPKLEPHLIEGPIPLS